MNTEFHTPRLTLHFRHPFFRTIIPTPTPLPSERGQIWQPVQDDPDPAPSDDESYPSQDDFGSSATIATEPLLQDNHFMTQQTGYYPLQHIQPQRPTPQSNQHHYPQPQQHRPQRSASRGRRPQAPQWSGRKQPPPKPQKRAPVRPRTMDPTVRYQKSVVRSERWYDILEAMLMSIPDAQILLSLAVSLNFAVRRKCTLSLYHLRIALNLILIGCTNFVLAYTIVRNHWRAPIAGVVRIAYLITALYFLGRVLLQQVMVGEQPEQEPPKTMNYSMILLSADCFLNKTLIKTVENSTADAVGIIGQLQHITWGSLTESFWFLILVLLSIFSLLHAHIPILQVRLRRTAPKDP